MKTFEDVVAIVAPCLVTGACHRSKEQLGYVILCPPHKEETGWSTIDLTPLAVGPDPVGEIVRNRLIATGVIQPETPWPLSPTQAQIDSVDAMLDRTLPPMETSTVEAVPERIPASIVRDGLQATRWLADLHLDDSEANTKRLWAISTISLLIYANLEP